MKLAVKVVAILISFAFVAAACGSGGDSNDSAATTQPAPTTTDLIVTDTLPETTTSTTLAPAVPTTTTLPRRSLTEAPIQPKVRWRTSHILVAKERPILTNRPRPETISVYDAPDGNLIKASQIQDGAPVNPNVWGTDLTFLVTSGQPGDEWAEVILSSRPNDFRGWVRTDKFNWQSHNYHITVDLSDNTVTVWNGNILISHSLAILGKEGARTPEVMTTYVEAKIENTVKASGARRFSNVYGTWILPLAAFSESFTEFLGGIPQLAIHGTHFSANPADPADSLEINLGTYQSSGCIRLANDVIEKIVEVIPVGTVVNIIA